MFPIEMMQAGKTALIWAAEGGFDTVVSILIDRGASVDTPDRVSCFSVFSFASCVLDCAVYILSVVE